MEHHHEHEPPVPDRSGDKVDPDQTERLLALAGEHPGTPLAHFAFQAAKAAKPYDRAYWLRRVEGAEHNAERARAKAKLAAAERDALERWERTAGTEAELNVRRVIGNGVVLGLVPGMKRPTGGYSLTWRRQGETRGTGEGRPIPDGKGGHQWVVQGLPLGEVVEFTAVSEDESGYTEVTGPVLAVPIGVVTTAAVNAAAAAEAKREHDEAEAAAAEETARVQRERLERAEALQAQGEAARAANVRREAEALHRRKVHREAVAELPRCAPRELSYKLRDTKGPLLCDITFRRGLKAPDIYQFRVNGTVLGYFPDGRHSGRKPPDHLYRRTVEIPRGRPSRIEVYGVTRHGNAEGGLVIGEPDQPDTRQARIEAAVRDYEGPRTLGFPSGRPYLRPLRKRAKMPDITGKERDAAARTVAGATD